MAWREVAEGAGRAGGERLRPRRAEDKEIRGEASASERAGGGAPAPLEEKRAGRFQDEGRFVVTGKLEDHGAFKTPTLREIARTAPYMHDGTFSTLEEVIDYYDRGGNKNPFLDAELRPLGLSDTEKQALLAFLRSLNGDISEGPDPERGARQHATVSRGIRLARAW